jgi:hypothetical protein
VAARRPTVQQRDQVRPRAGSIGPPIHGPILTHWL